MFCLKPMVLKKFIISSDCPTGPKEILNFEKYGYLFKTKSVKDLEKILSYKNNQNTKKMIKLGYKSLNRFDLKKNNQKYFNLVSNYL